MSEAVASLEKLGRRSRSDVRKASASETWAGTTDRVQQPQTTPKQRDKAGEAKGTDLK